MRNTNAPTQQNRTPQQPVSQPVSSVRVSPRPVPTSAPVAARSYASRSASQPQPRTVIRTVPASSPPSSPSPSFSVAPVVVPEPVNPQEAWLAASTAGVFGAMPPMQAPETPAEAIAQEPEPEYELQSANYVQEAEDSGLFSAAESVPGLVYNGPLTIPMGSSAKAEVISPISWLGENDQFVLQTTEDVLSNSDQVAIPSGSRIVVQPISVDESSRIAKLAAVAVEISGEMIPIDYKKVAIRGAGGDPLIAEKYGNVGGDIASNDLEMFAVGALGGIGDILTRPNSQTVTSGTFSSSSNTEYGDRNILGAVLSGGTRDLTSRMADRNDERLSEIRSRGIIYYLPEGEEVQLYVNSEFSL